jgi:L-rhamnose mutarotase
MKGEYRKRHDTIWPEMSELLTAAGVCNYSIWCSGELLFGYFETEDVRKACRILADSPINQRWDVYMDDIVTFEADPATGNPKEMELMFYFP